MDRVEATLVGRRRAGLVAHAGGAGAEGGDAAVGAEARGVRARVGRGLGRRDAGAVGIVEVAAVEGARGQCREWYHGGLCEKSGSECSSQPNTAPRERRDSKVQGKSKKKQAPARKGIGLRTYGPFLTLGNTDF